jgi:hypothetical protein
MNEESIKNEDYIELPPLKKITIRLLRIFFSIVDQLFEVLKKNKLLLLTGMITGMAVGFSYNSSRSVYYEVSMIAESSVVYRKTLAEMVQSLNDLIGSGSQIKLARELDMSEDQAREISRIELTGMFNESLENDTSTKYNQPFKIIARIHNTTLTDTFQKAIVFYLNNKPLLKKIRDEQVAFYLEKLNFTNRQLAKLDSLQTDYNRFLSSSKVATTYYSNDVDPSTTYKQANDLINEKGTVLYWLSQNSKPIQVIDEFKSPALPQSYSGFKSLVYGALIGLGICFFLGLYIELYRKTENYKGKA